MRTSKTNSNRFFSKKAPALLAATALGLVVSLSANVTHAGFQWVPPAGQAAAPAPAPAASAEVPVVIPSMPAGAEPALPMPGEEMTPPPAAPVQQQTLQLPSDYEAQPLSAPPQHAVPAPQPVMHVKQITPPPAPAPSEQVEIPMPVEQEPIALQEPVRQQQAPMQITATKVIMPEDAPQKAMDETPNSQKLVINPYPGSNPDSAPQKLQPINAAPAQNLSARDMAPPPAQQNMNFATVEGFGSDMPLALAVQQVAPPEYAFSFDPSINPGQKVSWEGGRPWNLVLNDMVAPLNLQAVISGKVVRIEQQGTQHRSDAGKANAVNASAAATMRRGNIKDPGEAAAAQAAPEENNNQMAENLLAGVAPAAGTEGPAPAEASVTVPMPEEEQAQPQVQAEATPTPAAKKPEEIISIRPVEEQQVASAQQEEPKEKQDIVAAEKSTGAPAWDAKAGESLKEILARWSEKAGVELLWMASYDYKITQDISIQDNFDKAVAAVISSGIDAKNNAPVERMVQSSEGKPATLLVQDKG